VQVMFALKREYLIKVPPLIPKLKFPRHIARVSANLEHGDEDDFDLDGSCYDFSGGLSGVAIGTTENEQRRQEQAYKIQYVIRRLRAYRLGHFV